MEIIKARHSDLQTVRDIVHGTINDLYPKYYPQGAVEYFLDYHADEAMMADIEKGNVYLLKDGGVCVGTGSIIGNEIGRLFVRPENQGRGYGQALMDFLEKTVYVEHDEILLYSSLLALNMYLKRGYQMVEYEKLLVNYGHFLCYHTLKRPRIDSPRIDA